MTPFDGDKKTVLHEVCGHNLARLPRTSTKCEGWVWLGITFFWALPKTLHKDVAKGDAVRSDADHLGDDRKHQGETEQCRLTANTPRFA